MKFKHIETRLGIVNIRERLNNVEGQEVVSIEILADDNTEILLPEKKELTNKVKGCNIRIIKQS